jgi:formate/nitrite transporter FocA (FNT family)
LGFGQAVALGIMCNALVCLAIWLTYAARSVTDKVLAIVFPITAFVAAGFEHSVANMYFLPMGSWSMTAARRRSGSPAAPAHRTSPTSPGRTPW